MWSRIAFLTTLAAVLTALAQAQDPTNSAPRGPIGVNNALNWRRSNGGPRDVSSDRTAPDDRNSRTEDSDSRGIAAPPMAVSIAVSIAAGVSPAAKS